MVTVGSILGGRGMWIWYLFLSTLKEPREVKFRRLILQDNCETTQISHLINKYASPDSHALLNVSRGHLVTQIHHKLGKLFDIDDVFGVFRVCIDDLCTSVGTKKNW